MCSTVTTANPSRFDARSVSIGMYEVEVKVRGDHGVIRSKLAELDATRTATVQQVDTYYDAPHRDFAETDEALRIRTETDANEMDADSASNPTPDVTQLTYKGPRVDDNSKTREESETNIESREVMDDILGSLGFSLTAVVEKDRERYALDEYTVTLDTVAGLGEFIEIEREIEHESDGSIETAREGAFSLLRAMDLDPADQIRTSYLGLLDNN